MTEPTTALEPPRPVPPEVPLGSDGRIHSSDVLMHIIVTFLVPMFYEASGCDLHFARLAALETVTSYRAHTHADLIAIAQIVAYGFAALASLSASLADTISLSMALRLRGNANACSRSAERNRGALQVNRPDATWAPHHTLPDNPEPAAPADMAYEAAVIASVADSQNRVAAAQARLRDPASQPIPVTMVPAPTATVAPSAPAATPAPLASTALLVRPALTTAPVRPAATTTSTPPASAAIRACPVPAVAPALPAPASTPTRATAAAVLVRQPSTTTPPPPATHAPANPTEQQIQSMWAAAMADVAGEFTASLPHLPAAERKLVSRRAAALSSCANQLIAGPVPPRPRPGDRAAMVRLNPG
jgi:hypothetical protein